MEVIVFLMILTNVNVDMKNVNVYNAGMVCAI